MNDLEDERIQENSTPFDNYWYKDKKKASETFTNFLRIKRTLEDSNPRPSGP